MKFLFSIVTALALLTLLFALPTTAAPPGDSPILIITSIQVAPDGADPEIIRTGTMTAELKYTNTAPTLDPIYDVLKFGLIEGIQPQHTATAGEIMLVRSLKGDTVSDQPPDPMSRTI